MLCKNVVSVKGINYINIKFVGKKYSMTYHLGID